MEEHFLSDNKNHGRFNVICGNKGSGKTHFVLNFIKLAYKYNIYEKYIFIIPEIEHEHDGQYAFLMNHKDTTIYSEFDPDIIDNVKEMSKQYHVLLVLDDATDFLFKNRTNPSLMKLVSTCRHGKGVTIFSITHALKSILTPTIRALIDHLFIGSFTNANIIKNQLYSENFSIIMDYKEFLSSYLTNIIKEKYNFLYFNRNSEYDFNVKDWNMSNLKLDLKQNGRSQLKILDRNKKLVDKIKERKHYKELISKYDPPEQKLPKRLISKNKLIF